MNEVMRPAREWLLERGWVLVKDREHLVFVATHADGKGFVFAFGARIPVTDDLLLRTVKYWVPRAQKRTLAELEAEARELRDVADCG